MKKINLKQIAASLLVCMLLLVASVIPAFAADSNVTYDGNAQEVVTLPGNDLFPDLKGLMPGSETIQKIQLRNSSSDTILVYLRAEAIEEQDEIAQELLTKLEIIVSLSARDMAERVVYQGKLSDMPKMEGNPILMATMMQNTNAQIEVTLKVPESLSNRFQNAAAKIKWVFYCEIKDRPVISIPEESTPLNPPSSTPEESSRPVISIPEESTPLNPPSSSRPVIDIPDESTPLNDPTLVQTGDTADYTIIIVILVVAIVLVVVMLILKKRADSHKQDR